MNQPLDSRHPTVLVVDDDESERELIALWLEREGFQVQLASSGEDCLALLPTVLPDVVCMDLHMPGMGGQMALEHLQRTHEQLPILILTADEEVDTAVRAMRAGAYDYLVKPIDRQRFVKQVHNASERSQMQLRLTQLEREAAGQGYPGIVGNSAPMQRLFREMDRVAPSDVTVLIRGESGTGKELIAQAVHEHSGYADGPFVALNCAAIPESLQESEMFGHEKGAFTGADELRKGRFEEADGGTLFLDEVAELSLSLQAKLLRVLQERSFRRVGGRSEIHSQFRLVAASHKDLQQEVRAGRFREDLFFRLAVFELDLPALRERIDDLPALSQHFLQRFATKSGGQCCRIEEQTVAIMRTYAWPGNVRELENALHRAHVVAHDGLIRSDDLPARILSQGEVNSTPSLQPSASPPTTTAPPQPPVHAAPASLDEMERQAILNAIEATQGNLSEVARQLGIGRTTLYRKLRKYGLR